MLLHSRIDIIQLLLDTDARNSTSQAWITPAALADLGCPPNFLADQVTFVGTAEYEDAFDAAVIARGLDAEFPRSDGAPWEPMVAGLKAQGGKFSAALRDNVFNGCRRERRNDARKPNIAAAVARACTTDDVPTQILAAFNALRQRAVVNINGP